MGVTAYISVVTRTERFKIIKRNCWVPFSHWRSWIAGKPITVNMQWVKWTQDEVEPLQESKKGEV